MSRLPQRKMSRKDRLAWESQRRNNLDVRSCDHCSRWGDTPSLDRDYDGTPLACELLTSESAYRYEVGLKMPEYEVFHHHLATEIMGDKHECGWDCGVRHTKNTSGQEGLSLFEKVKMAYRIEDLAANVTEMYGSHTQTGPCPFHNGSGRELVVWTEIQEWKCYGRCQTGGDVIHFIVECKKAGLNWAIPTDTNLEKLH